MNKTVLFVYGTLRQGHSAHALLAGGAYLGTVTTLPQYDLAHLGAYPGLLRGGKTAVTGELYLVDERTIQDLDEYEGHPDYFHRGIVVLSNGREVAAYFYPRDRAAGSPRIPGGDWKE